MTAKNTRTVHVPPTHPGEVLLEEFLKPMGITPYALAKALGVPVSRIDQIIKERRGISADTALRLEKYLGNAAQFWLNIQNHHDLMNAKAKAKAEYDGIEAHAA